VSEKILVTGATGFIGSHLAEELLWKGFRVTALVRSNSNLQWLRGKNVDILPGDFVTGTLPSLDDFAYIFHVAGLTKAWRRRDFFKVNAEGTRNLVAAAQKAGSVRHFVYLSSSAASGPCPSEHPRREDETCRPVSAYGESKRRGEEVVFAAADELPITILRPSAVYGPRDEYMLSYFKMIAKGFMPCIGRGPLWLSLCYVDDLVDALVRCITHDHSSGQVYSVSDGGKYSLDFFADVVSLALHVRPKKIFVPEWAAWFGAFVSEAYGRVSGRSIPFHRSKCAEAVQRHWICSIARAKEDLGFRPRFGLEAGIRVTVQWYQDHGWL